jgi:hypothetical protein
MGSTGKNNETTRLEAEKQGGPKRESSKRIKRITDKDPKKPQDDSKKPRKSGDQKDASKVRKSRDKSNPKVKKHRKSFLVKN